MRSLTVFIIGSHRHKAISDVGIRPEFHYLTFSLAYEAEKELLSLYLDRQFALKELEYSVDQFGD